MGARESIHRGPERSEIAYSVPCHNPGSRYDPTTQSISEGLRNLGGVVSDESESVSPKQGAKSEGKHPKQGVRDSKNEAMVSMKANTEHTDLIGYAMFWLHQLLVLVVLIVANSSKDSADVSDSKVDATYGPLVVAELIGVVGGSCVMAVNLFSGADLVTVHSFGGMVGLLGLATVSFAYAAYSVGVLFVIMVLGVVLWYITHGRPYRMAQRKLMNGGQQVLQIFPGLKWAVVSISILFLAWMQLWNAAIHACMRFQGAAWVIVIGFVTSTITAGVVYFVVACMVIGCINCYFEYLERLEDPLTHDFVQRFQQQGGSVAVSDSV